MTDALPPAYTVDANGKPLHSWRTLILPFLEQQALYETIDLTKPWDDPVNATGAQLSPLWIYHCPSDGGPQNRTTYLANVAPNGCFNLKPPKRLSELGSGGANALLLVEVPLDRSIPWMCPDDADETLILSIGPDSKLEHAGVFNGAMCDGSFHSFPADLPAADRKAMPKKAEAAK